VTHKTAPIVFCKFLCVLWSFVTLFCVAPVAFAQRTTSPFDRDWRFLKADPSGAEKPEFEDSGSRR
jgi:hypothetical protein